MSVSDFLRIFEVSLWQVHRPFVPRLSPTVKHTVNLFTSLSSCP